MITSRSAYFRPELQFLSPRTCMVSKVGACVYMFRHTDMSCVQHRNLCIVVQCSISDREALC